MNEMWNQRYNEAKNYYGVKPNEFFREYLDDLEDGNILLPCEGEGRNAFYALLKGFKVTAFDFSDQARQNALQLIGALVVNLDYQICEYSSFNSDIKFDMIALIYAHIHESERRAFHRRLISMLKPGGKIIIEAFNKNQLKHNSFGPKDIKMLYSSDEIMEDFQDMNIEYCEELTLDLNEGIGHRGIGEVIRFVGSL